MNRRRQPFQGNVPNHKRLQLKASYTSYEQQKELGNERYHPDHRDHVRAIAEAAAKRIPESTARVKNYARIVRRYCELVLSYRDRFVVADYLTRRLKETIPARMRQRWRNRVQPWTREALNVVLRYVRGLADQLLEELESRIIDLMTYDSRAVLEKQQLPRNRRAIRTRLTEGPRRSCVVIIEPRANGEPQLIDLDTYGAFGQRQRRRIRGERYVRPNPGERNYPAIH